MSSSSSSSRRSPSRKKSDRSPKVAPTGGGRGGTQVRPPKASAADRRAGALMDSSLLAADILKKKERKERSKKELSDREKNSAVGSWMFGEGGVAGLSISQAQKRKIDTAEKKVDVGETGTASGFAMNLQHKEKGKRRGLTQAPDKIEVVMSKYEKKTKQYRERREAALGKDVAKGPRRERGVPEKKSLKESAKESACSCWSSITKCFSTIWNGATIDEEKAVESQPIILGGIYRRTVELAGVTQAQLRKLRSVFRSIDFSKMGDISLVELFEFLDEQPSPFVYRLYRQVIASQIGDNPDSTLNYDNFVLFVLVFGLMTETEMLQFIFDTFDADSSGFLDEEEIVVLLNVVNHDRPMFPGNFHKMLMDFDTDGDGHISFKEFVMLHKSYPSALFPAFRVQNELQRRTLGFKEFTIIGTNGAQMRKDIAEREKAAKREARRAKKARSPVNIGRPKA